MREVVEGVMAAWNEIKTRGGVRTGDPWPPSLPFAADRVSPSTESCHLVAAESFDMPGGEMTDYEWRAAELMLKLAIATKALQQKHEETLELIEERNKWQAIAESRREDVPPVSGLVTLSSADENA
jgi:hypothetical protein